MSDTVQSMRVEHTNLMKLLHLFQLQMDAFSQGEKPNFDLVRDILDYITNYFERVHHAKEEIMLGRLQARCPEMESRIAQIRSEHEQLSQLTHNVVATLDDIIVDSNMMSRESVTNLAADFINISREHITHEEQFIFPSALSHLKEKDWKEIDSSMPAPDDPLFGKEVQQQYRVLYQSILDQGNTADSV